MMQTVPSWTATLTFTDGRIVNARVSDFCYSNVLRKVAELDFEGVASIVLSPTVPVTNQTVTASLVGAWPYAPSAQAGTAK